MAILKTLGIGGDFADIGTLFNEYKEGTAGMPDDIEVTQISDFTEATGCDTRTYMVMNNHKLTIRNPNGYKITIPDWTKHYQIFVGDAVVGDELEIDGLNVYLPYYHNAQNIFYCRGVYWGNVVKSIYKNISVFGQGDAGTGAMAFVIGNGLYNKSDVLNCRVYNTFVGVYVYLSSGALPGTGPCVIENCTIYKCGTGLKTFGVNTSAASATTFKNCVAPGNTIKDFDIGVTGASAYQSIINCADSDNSIASADATKSGNITGITDGDFLSVDSTDVDNFLNIDQSSALYEKGSTAISSWNNFDLAGNPRPHGTHALVSIGAFEGIYSIPPGDYFITNHSVSILKGLIQSWTKTATNRVPIMEMLGAHTANRSNPHQVSIDQLYAGPLPEYADNAAAIAGGLEVGKSYRNGDFVCVVH